MADFVFNISKGRVGAYVQNVKDGSPANSRLKVIPLEATGLEADAALKDHNELAALLAGSSNEQATMGRKTIVAGDITLTVDDSGEKLDIDLTDIVWAAAAGNALGSLVLVYCPDGVTPGADNTFIPLTNHVFAVTPDGSDITAVINAAGFYRAS